MEIEILRNVDWSEVRKDSIEQKIYEVDFFKG